MKKVLTKTIIFVAYFLGLFILQRISNFSLSLSFFSSSALDLAFWFIGAIIGTHLIKLDQLFYVYVTKPADPLSQEIQALVKEKKVHKVWDLLENKAYVQKELASRSILFQLAWTVLVLFTISSYAGVFGKGLVLGIGLKILIEEWESFLSTGHFSWAFWQIKREVTPGEQKTYLYIMTGLFTILTLLLI